MKKLRIIAAIMALFLAAQTCQVTHDIGKVKCVSDGDPLNGWRGDMNCTCPPEDKVKVIGYYDLEDYTAEELEAELCDQEPPITFERGRLKCISVNSPSSLDVIMECTCPPNDKVATRSYDTLIDYYSPGSGEGGKAESLEAELCNVEPTEAPDEAPTEAPLSVDPILGGAVTYCEVQSDVYYLNLPLSPAADLAAMQFDLDSGDLVVQVGGVSGNCKVVSAYAILVCSFPAALFSPAGINTPDTDVTTVYKGNLVDTVQFDNVCSEAQLIKPGKDDGEIPAGGDPVCDPFNDSTCEADCTNPDMAELPQCIDP